MVDGEERVPRPCLDIRRSRDFWHRELERSMLRHPDGNRKTLFTNIAFALLFMGPVISVSYMYFHEVVHECLVHSSNCKDYLIALRR
jgi:hypothetical protein